jgi:transposase-like protein
MDPDPVPGGHRIRRYPAEVRAEVVRAVIEQRLSYTEAARRYGMGEDTIKRWIETAHDDPTGALLALGKTNHDQLHEVEHRVAQLHLRSLELERRVVELELDVARRRILDAGS